MKNNIIKLLAIAMLFGIPSTISAEDTWLEDASTTIEDDGFNDDGCPV